MRSIDNFVKAEIYDSGLYIFMMTCQNKELHFAEILKKNKLQGCYLNMLLQSIIYEFATMW